jgi:hypothetical protein
MDHASIQREFLIALQDGDALRTKALLAAGARVNEPINDPEGSTPLIRAIQAGQPASVQLLLAAGADANQRDTGLLSRTPLMYAHDQPALLELLLKAGADVQARTPVRENLLREPGRVQGGESALHLAAAAKNAEAIRLLTQAGAEVEAKDANGLAPIDYALRLGSANEATAALVQAGAQLTPERVEIMHSAAHNPEWDLAELRAGFLPPGADAASNRTPPELHAPPEPSAAFKDWRCPGCGALLYSHHAKVCGSCGLTLPAGMVLSRQQAQAARESRQWARDLANAFGAAGGARPLPRNLAPSRTTAQQPAEVLERVSCAAEFRARPRPWFWSYVLLQGCLLVGFTWISTHIGLLSITAWCILLGVLALGCFLAWRNGAPNCPRCQRNIRTCPAHCCHVCGEPLNAGRCSTCNVDFTWTGLFSSFLGSGNTARIAYCPGCGAWLDSPVRRWRAGRGV